MPVSPRSVPRFSPATQGLDSVLVVAPGVEIINRSGDLTLGQANTTGSTSNDARSTADWDLSSWRYGSRSAPGVLTLRASGDLVFNNTLSDGFTPVAANANNGWSSMWLAQLMTINNNLPINTQSWSYRLSAGADLGAADFQAVRSVDSLQAGKGSILVGEFYAAVPNSFSTGSAAGIGSQGQTADSIRIATSSTDTTNRGTRFESHPHGYGQYLSKCRARRSAPQPIRNDLHGRRCYCRSDKRFPDGRLLCSAYHDLHLKPASVPRHQAAGLHAAVGHGGW